MSNQFYKTVPLSYFKARLHYNPSSGELTWRDGPRKGKKAGSNVKANDNYLQICISYEGKISTYQGHRIIWALVNGEFPADGLVIDHIDSDTTNNRISNLRVVTRQENSKNIRKVVRKNCDKYVKTSVFGVKLDKKTLEYIVTFDTNVEHRFDDFDSAKYARWSWEFDNGFHEMHGVK